MKFGSVCSGIGARELQILRAARAEIVKRGQWTRGHWQIGGARCALGWLRWAAQDLAYDVSGADLLYNHLPIGWRDSDRVEAVAGYNDHVRRRKRDIVRLYDRAIAAREDALLNE